MAAEDVASLGLSVNSSPVEKATKSLDRFSASGHKAQSSATKLNSATDAARASIAGVASASGQSTSALGRLKSALLGVLSATTDANDNMVKTRANVAGLAAQFQDVGVTAAMDMSPMMIALQQDTQLAGQMQMEMQRGGSAVGVLAQAFGSLLSPISIASIALTSFLAYGLQMVDWASAVATALNTIANILPDIAVEASIAGGALALAFSPGIVKSVWALSTALVSGVAKGLAIVAKGLAIVAAAALANPLTAIVIALGAAATAAVLFRDEITKAIGVDVVGVMKDTGNAIIGSMVGAYDAIGAVWSGLPSALGDWAIQAAQMVLDTFTQMARDVIAKINGMIASINGMLRDAGAGFSIDMMGAPVSLIPRTVLDNPYAGAGAGVSGAISDVISGAMNTDYLGNMGESISNAAGGAAAKIKELAALLANMGKKGDKAGGKTKSAIDKAAKAAEALREKTLQAQNSLGQGLGGVLKGLLDGTTSLKDALFSVLQNVLTYMDQINVAGGGAGILGGGLFQGIAGGLLGVGFANGGYTGNGATSSVAGAVHGKEYVFSAKATKAIGVKNLDAAHNAAKGYSSGGYVTPAKSNDNARTEVIIQNNIDATGADPAAIARLNEQLDEMQAGLPGQVQAVVNRNSTRGSYR